MPTHLRRRRKEMHYLETNPVRRILPKHNFPVIVTGFINSHGRAMPTTFASVLAKKGVNLDLSDVTITYYNGSSEISKYNGNIENADLDRIISLLSVHTSKKNKKEYFEIDLHLNEPLDAQLNAPLTKYSISYSGSNKYNELVSVVEDCIKQVYER